MKPLKLFIKYDFSEHLLFSTLTVSSNFVYIMETCFYLNLLARIPSLACLVEHYGKQSVHYDWHTYFLRRKQTGVFHDGMTHSALQTPIITSTERIQPLLWTPLTRNYLSTYITFMPFDAFVHAQYPSSFTGKSCSPLWLQLPQQDFAVCHFLSQVCHLHVL